MDPENLAVVQAQVATLKYITKSYVGASFSILLKTLFRTASFEVSYDTKPPFDCRMSLSCIESLTIGGMRLNLCRISMILIVLLFRVP